MQRKHWCYVFVGAGILKLLAALVISRYFLKYAIAPSPSQPSFDDSIHASVSPYPAFIPRTRVRRNSDGRPVERGRLQKLGGISTFALGRTFLNTTRPLTQVIGATNDTASKLVRAYKWRKREPQVSLGEFRRTLQCAVHEPDLDGTRGTLSLLKLTPVTAQTIRVMAAYVESFMSCSPWAQCGRLADYLTLKHGLQKDRAPGNQPPAEYDDTGDAALSDRDKTLFVKTFKRTQFAPPDDRTRLMRVSGGVLYTDWPWAAWRWHSVATDYFALRLMGAVLELTALPDCAFFMRNYDYPLFPAFVAMPAFSHAPSLLSGDIPFPWVRAVDDEVSFYQDQLVEGKAVYEELFFDDSYAAAASSRSDAGEGAPAVGRYRRLQSQPQKKLRQRQTAQEAQDLLLQTTGSGITGTSVSVLDSRPVSEEERRQDREKAIGRDFAKGKTDRRHEPIASGKGEERTASETASIPAVAPAKRDEALSVAAWQKKLSKAAFYGYLWSSRSSTARIVALDLARKYPEFLDVEWTAAFLVQAYSPLSNEEEALDGAAILATASRNSTVKVAATSAGYLRNIAGQKQKRKKSPREYLSSHKYLLVLSGNNGADRLAAFFAHSGAVILMQENDALSHFSARLKPWVHYVPITHTAADAADKIRWLREHDAEAYQIAKNGYFFGQSFLRLEDLYCHAAASLQAVSEVEAPDAKKLSSGARPAFAF